MGECIYVFLTVAEFDYFGVPFNLSFTRASVQSGNISILDGDVVERPEVIQLLLASLTPGIILIEPNSSLITITDNDGKIFFLQ